jgi:DNA-binding CsgD family transcriptional regulator
MTRDALLDLGRDAVRRRAWREAFTRLSAADAQAPLEPADLEALASAAHLMGNDAESAQHLSRAHYGYLEQGEVERAARCAFWLAFGLLERGEAAQGSGWLARARRLLDDGRRDCVECGYLLLPIALQQVAAGDIAGAHATFTRAAEYGDRFADPDLTTLARHGQGRTLTRLGETARGVALLDEVMVAVTSGEVSPIIVGTVYCSVISACHDIFDLRRAQEWTDALSRWCAAQPDLVPYRGTCLVRRAELLQMHGAWPDAVDEARQARERLSQPPEQPSVGAAHYQLAELHRLRGEFAEAEAAYRAASRWRKPQPGLALLRLAQGQIEAAHAGVRGALDEASGDAARARVLVAFIEIALAAGDVTGAEAAARELAEIAGRLEARYLLALSDQASGAVLLAQDRPREALPALRRAWAVWRDLEAPYEAARVRVLVAQACRSQGDRDTADMELEAARATFEQLGAAPDLARLESLTRVEAPVAATPLSAREVQVLRLVASGKTNRAIAGALGISEKTVARHVSNIFTKLGLSSRAAATAYAYQHDLVQTRPT